ncbi:LOW QUALITY PROTEIN: ras GTPase-activating protein-binding protein 1-like [Choristoneura fumiferana]|uniref:LOW QUALITY PROTEIN: ras GTPase-activating protein-binding protein 1-like n=1 Tax=Choristoneura fumiferana TaxID=7141 RepID=UPI003D153E06
MVMEASPSPSPQSVGREFVRQYYTLLNKAPTHLHRFYNNFSSFVHGGLEAPQRETLPVVGQKQIHNRIQQLNFRDCHAKISQVDSQATLGSGVVVQVTGELSNAGAPMRRFTQTFVLAAQSPKKYYVHNDIFRYQDLVPDDEPEPEREPEQERERDDAEPAGYFPAPPAFPPLFPAPPRVSPPLLPPQLNGHPAAAPAPAPAPSPPPAPAPAPASAPADAPQEPRPMQHPIHSGVVSAEPEPEPAPAAEPAPEPEPPREPTPPAAAAAAAAAAARRGAVPAGAQDVRQPAEVERAARARARRRRRRRRPASAPAPAAHEPPRPRPQRAPRDHHHPAEGASGGMRGERGERGEGGGGGGGGRRYSDSQQLFLGNVPPSATEDELRALFARFGPVAELRVLGRPPHPHYGFVTYESARSAQDCLGATPLYFPPDSPDGVKLNVEEKKTRGAGPGAARAGDAPRRRPNSTHRTFPPRQPYRR